MKYEELANWRHYLSKDYINKHRGAIVLAALVAAWNIGGTVGGIYKLYALDKDVSDLKNRQAQIEQNRCTVTLPDSR